MAYYKIVFPVYPVILKNADNPPSNYVRYYSGEEKPNKEKIKSAFISAMSTALDGKKVLDPQITLIGVEDFEKKGKYDELFI